MWLNDSAQPERSLNKKKNYCLGTNSISLSLSSLPFTHMQTAEVGLKNFTCTSQLTEDEGLRLQHAIRKVTELSEVTDTKLSQLKQQCIVRCNRSILASFNMDLLDMTVAWVKQHLILIIILLDLDLFTYHLEFLCTASPADVYITYADCEIHHW